MNKEIIIKQLNESVKKVDKDFRIVDPSFTNGDLVLEVGGAWLCWFCHFDKNSFRISSDPRTAPQWWYEGVAKTGIIQTFYKKGIELLQKYDVKYTVSLSKDSTTNYLNIDKTTGGFFFSTNDDTDKVQAYFTKTEIENMKDDHKFEAINFEKAVIEEVED